jgi:hypothetical protein
MLPQCYPNYKTVHRRFQTWCRSEILRRVLTDIANQLRARGVLDEEESFIDVTFAMAKGGGADVGPTRKRPENHGDRRSSRFAALGQYACGEPSRVRLVQLCLDFYMIEAKPENLIGDRAYDSDLLDVELRRENLPPADCVIDDISPQR